MNKKAIAIVLVLALMLSTACGAAIKEEVAVEVESQTTAVPMTTIATTTTTTTTTVTTTTTEAERLSHAESIDMLIAFNDLSESLSSLMSIKFDTESLPLSLLSPEDKVAIIATHIGFLERYEVILDAALDLFTPYSESDLGFTLADQATFLSISYDLQELAQEVLDAPPVYD